MIMLLAAALMIVTGCKKDNNNANGEKMTFSADFDNGSAKTEIDGLNMSWNKGDAVMINGKVFTADQAGASTTLSGDQVSQQGGLYKAYYPADIYNDGTLTLPATQTYNGKNLSGVNPMYTQSGSTSLTFSNLCAIVKLQLTDSDKTVKEIRVTADKPLSGEFEIAEGDAGYKAVMKSQTSNAGVTLNCGAGVNLSTDKVFYVALPEGTYNLRFLALTTDNKAASIEIANATLQANKLYDVVRTPKFEDPVTPTVAAMIGCQSYSTYTIGGSVTVPTGSSYACEFGLVYSDSDNTPTIEEGAQKITVHTLSDPAISGTQAFAADLGTLTPGTTYYVRAYAMCEGLAYSDVVTVVGGEGPKPLPSNWNNGKNPHPFTVGPDKVVYFSQGNLQYIGSVASPYWKFADHQFDFFGNNGQESTSTTVNRDLLGWGTSGWDNGNQSYQPYATDKGNNMSGIGYGYGPTDGNNQYLLDLTGDYANADWGVYNTITNGVGSNWRTLTGGTSGGEWYYLIGYPTGVASRTDSQKLYGEGKVGNCTEGLIILPDDWKWEGDVEGFGPNATNPNRRWKAGPSQWANSYSYSEWSLMEAAGAVFLPVAGCRIGAGPDAVAYTSGAYYWSSTHWGSGNAYTLDFSKSNVGAFSSSHNRYCGCSVRLVSDKAPN